MRGVENFFKKLREMGYKAKATVALKEFIAEEGFSEELNYGMPGYVVPHSLYPAGYHCAPELPLPFASFASQKNFIGFYHMGLYADPELLEWFVSEYPKHCKRKLDMGKSCIRFKKMDDIPYKLLGELMAKITPQDWISKYESNIKK
ncbi:MAG: DUF1801 domain-containing protein [Flavobacteriales bacterium]|nr:DUF1801 domain-containing protein [Flavobacteriales bacterium]